MTEVRPEWHRIRDLDPEARTGTCSRCGPVSVKLKGSKNVAQCINKVREDAAKWAKGRTRRPSPNAVARFVSRGDRRRYKYGVTESDVEAMLASQAGRCPICDDSITEATCHVDHDHACCPSTGSTKKTCGKCVRGLLCFRCNTGLGRFRDDPAILIAAARYLGR